MRKDAINIKTLIIIIIIIISSSSSSSSSSITSPRSMIDVQQFLDLAGIYTL